MEPSGIIDRKRGWTVSCFSSHTYVIACRNDPKQSTVPMHFSLLFVPYTTLSLHPAVTKAYEYRAAETNSPRAYAEAY